MSEEGLPGRGGAGLLTGPRPSVRRGFCFWVVSSLISPPLYVASFPRSSMWAACGTPSPPTQQLFMAFAPPPASCDVLPRPVPSIGPRGCLLYGF